jgi:hypothetical protein
MFGRIERGDSLLHLDEEEHVRKISRVSLKSRFSNWHWWLNIILLFLVLEIAVLSIEQARWMAPQPSLTLALILALLTTWLLVISRIPGIITHPLVLVVGGLVTMWQATSTAVTGTGTFYFAIFLTALTWLMGYISIWFILRKQNAWVAVSLGAVAILVNLSNLPDRYYLFFAFYFLAAVILIAQTRITRQPGLWEGSTGYSGRSFLYLMVPLLCLVTLAVSISWVTPEVRVPQLETMIATRMLWKHDIEESKFNFFTNIPAKQSLNTSSTRRDLLFKKKWHQGEQVHFVVSSQIPVYWQVHIYDTYTSRGWTNRETERYMLEKGAKWCDPGMTSGSDKITCTVTTNLKTDILLTAGRFVSSDTTVLLHESGGDVFAVTTPRLLRPAERYTVTSIISSASPDSLSGASATYPKYIEDDYLQLPPDFPGSVRQLSRSITEGTKTPYEKVMAIDKYLSQIPYEEEVESPPRGTDGVEHFLFTQKSGYCLHFASAMAVMLRSVGVPSRLVVGYLPGEPGNDVGEYILRDKHYHSWPQAYFPGYGWVDLEVTPNSDSEVVVETPWVAGRFNEGQESMEAWLEWEMFYARQAMGYTGADTASKRTEIWNRQWPYADVLGKSLLYILGGAFLIALIVSPILALRSKFYRWLWGVIRSESASMVYARMCVLASMVRLGPKPHQTPLEYTAELTSKFPLQAEALDIIAQAYVENRFGRRGKLGLFEEAKLLKARRSVFDMLIQRLGFLKKLFYRR